MISSSSHYMSLFGFACPSNPYLWSSVSNTIFGHLKLFCLISFLPKHIWKLRFFVVYFLTTYIITIFICFWNHLNSFALGRFLSSIMRSVALPVVYSYYLVFIKHFTFCGALWLIPYLFTHSAISLLKYLLSTYWNQVPVLDLWYTVIHTNSKRSSM